MADGRFSPLPEPFMGKLSNGMDVLVVPDRRAPVAYHGVYYRVGAADEDAGKTGLAHFLEHLMFKGTEQFPEAQFSPRVAKLGGKDNAFTSADITAYYQRVPISVLEEVMAMEADRMTNLRLDEDDVVAERDVVLEERSTRIDNSPAAQFREELNAVFYRNHPYGRPLAGWRKEIEGLSREDALAFYKRFYHPSNAVLVVAGDISGQEVLAMAERTYGKILGDNPPPAHVRPQEPPIRATRILEMSDPRVGNPQFSTYFMAPSYVGEGGEDGPALDVLARRLGNDPSGLLYRHFVRDQKKALSIGAAYYGGARDHGVFIIYGIPAEGVSPEELHGQVMAFLSEFGAKTPSQDRVEVDKKALAGATLLALDSVGALAQSYARTVTLGGSVSQAAAWPQAIGAVTPEDLVQVANKYLDPKTSVTGFLTKEERP